LVDWGIPKEIPQDPRWTVGACSSGRAGAVVGICYFRSWGWGCGPTKCFKKACAVKAQGSLAQRGHPELHPFSTSLSALRNARRRRRISSFYAKRLKSKSWKTVSS